MDKTIIHLKRSFPFPAKSLFEAFLTADQFRQWFSPPGFEVGTVEINPVVGGVYFCQLVKENKPTLAVKGNYIAINRYDTISFTFLYEPDLSAMGESKVTVTFNEKDNNTEITLLQEIYKTIPSEGRSKGWGHILNNLERYINNPNQ
jgi:uncharacterized protein YndB with AHSA1/START domain